MANRVTLSPKWKSGTTANSITNTNSGNVGIGTTSPGNKLVVAGASTDTTTVHLDSGGHAYSQIDSGGNTYESLIRFMDGGSTRFTMGLDNDSAHTVFSIGDNALANKWLNVKNTGNVGIGTTSPTAVLHIKAGTATANAAPLKFTSGTVNTTAEAGTVEYDNTFRVTNSDATRRHVVTAPSTIKTTAGAPCTNDGYVVVNIGGTDFKVMTTA